MHRTSKLFVAQTLAARNGFKRHVTVGCQLDRGLVVCQKLARNCFLCNVIDVLLKLTQSAANGEKFPLWGLSAID